MRKNTQSSERKIDRAIVKLGSARRLTQAVQFETLPEMAGDKTQRIGG